jgi:hypothetical protein
MLKRKLYQTTFSVPSCIYEEWKACDIAGAWDARMQGEQAQLLAGFHPQSIVIPNCGMTLQLSAKMVNPRTLRFIEVRMRVRMREETQISFSTQMISVPLTSVLCLHLHVYGRVSLNDLSFVFCLHLHVYLRVYLCYGILKGGLRGGV